MDENKFDWGEWSDSWALLVLLAMSETNWDTVDVDIDKFTIEQLRAAAMNKKESEKLRQDMLRDATREEDDI
jgi:hypothetical protein